MADTLVIEPDVLRQILTYDAETGGFWWKERPANLFLSERDQRWWNARYAGKETATTRDANGYLRIKIFDTQFAAHRVAWAISHSDWPETIDHINGRVDDNRLSNLRGVSRLINQRNQRLHATNTSGFAGVTYNRFRGCWVAYVGVARGTKYLGSFASKRKAVEARSAYNRKHGFTERIK